MIISRAPYRISFFGGGTDFPDYFLQNESLVISASIDKFCYLMIKNLPEFFDHKFSFAWSKIERVNQIEEIEHPTIRNVLKYLDFKNEGLEIHHAGDMPARSGVGSSSAFSVALLNGLMHLKKSKIESQDLAKTAFYVESVLNKERVGLQDQIASAYGGLNRIDFFSINGESAFKVTPLGLTESYLKELQSWMVLLFLDVARDASRIEEDKFSNYKNNLENLHLIKSYALLAYEHIKNEDSIDRLATLLHKSWESKKALSSKVSNEKIEGLYDKAIKLGALGGKILGAGGGGFLFFLVPPNKRQNLIDNIGLVNVPIKISFQGPSVIDFENQ